MLIDRMYSPDSTTIEASGRTASGALLPACDSSPTPDHGMTGMRSPSVLTNVAYNSLARSVVGLRNTVSISVSPRSPWKMQPRPSWFEMSDHLAAGIAPGSCWSLMKGHASAVRAGPAGAAAIAKRRTRPETRRHMMRIRTPANGPLLRGSEEVTMAHL